VGEVVSAERGRGGAALVRLGGGYVSL
jgi:hypothetical protein